MAVTFLRKYQLVITSQEITFFNGNPATATPVIVKATIEENQIQANLKVSANSSVASADNNTVIIYNAEERVSKALRETGAKITLRAGYESDTSGVVSQSSDLPIIFIGEVVKMNEYRTQTDKVTKVTLSTTITNKKESTINATFPKNTKVKTIFETFAQQLGLEANIQLGDKEQETLTSDRSYNGNTIQILDKEVKRLGLASVIQNEKLFIANRDQLSSLIQGGLVYKIEAGRIKGTINWSVDTTTSSQDRIDVTLTTFLLPNILIGDSVEVLIDDSLTTLVIDAIEHNLDYRGDVWDTKITCKTEPKGV